MEHASKRDCYGGGATLLHFGHQGLLFQYTLSYNLRKMTERKDFER